MVVDTVTNLRSLDEECLLDELLEEFDDELRGTGVPDYALLERCPAARREELRSLMDTAALLHWAGQQTRKQEQRGPRRLPARR